MMSGHNADAIRRIKPTGPGEPLRFVIAGDTSFTPNPAGDAVFRRLLAHINALNQRPQFFVNLGDFCGPGTVERHQHYRDLVSGLEIPALCVMGNHELDAPEGAPNFHELYGPANYSFTCGDALFIAIGSFERREQPHGPEAEDIVFLQATLEADAGRHPMRVVLMHMPPNLNDHYAPCTGPAWAFTAQEAEFLRIVEEQNVALVCAAHITGFDTFLWKRTRFVVSGAGGGAVGSSYAEVYRDAPPFRAGFSHFVEIVTQRDHSIEGRVFRADRAAVEAESAYAF